MMRVRVCCCCCCCDRGQISDEGEAFIRIHIQYVQRGRRDWISFECSPFLSVHSVREGRERERGRMNNCGVGNVCIFLFELKKNCPQLISSSFFLNIYFTIRFCAFQRRTEPPLPSTRVCAFLCASFENKFLWGRISYKRLIKMNRKMGRRGDCWCHGSISQSSMTLFHFSLSTSHRVHGDVIVDRITRNIDKPLYTISDSSHPYFIV